jgi:hypothetical protein
MRRPRRDLPGPATEQFCVENRPEKNRVPATLHGLRTVDKVFWNPPAEVRVMPERHLPPDFAMRCYRSFPPNTVYRLWAGDAPPCFVPNG